MYNIYYIISESEVRIIGSIESHDPYFEGLLPWLMGHIAEMNCINPDHIGVKYESIRH